MPASLFDKPQWPLAAQVEYIIFNLGLTCRHEVTCVAVF